MDNRVKILMDAEVIKNRLNELGIVYWEEDGYILYKSEIFEYVH